MSGATWGGSSSEEEEEEEGVSSGTGLNDTRDDLEQTFTGTLGMYIQYTQDLIGWLSSRGEVHNGRE